MLSGSDDESTVGMEPKGGRGDKAYAATNMVELSAPGKPESMKSKCFR